METTRVQRSEIMDHLIANTEQQLSNLKSRWLAESKYEDFNDYKPIISKLFLTHLPSGSKIISISKTFNIVLEIPGFPYQPKVYLTTREFGWKS